MPLLEITREWEGEEAFIIGGGSSLQGFDFSKLSGRKVIGVNYAYRLGHPLIDICLFGDAGFFQKNRKELSAFPGRKVTCCPSLSCIKEEWLWHVGRQQEGWPSGNKLVWHYSTGAAAIHLAQKMGAQIAYLLGFDGGRNTTGGTHWHNFQPEKKILDEAYRRFLKGFATLSKQLREHCPGFQVLNVVGDCCHIPAEVFPRISFSLFDDVLHPPQKVAV